MKTGTALSHDGVELHYLENSSSNPMLTSVIFVPGMIGCAEDWAPFVDAVSPRRALSFSHRGLGPSPSKLTSAKWQDRAKDIHSVAAAAKLNRYFVCAHSRGVILAIQEALSHPGQVAGLILIDCDARYMKTSEAWLEHVKRIVNDPSKNEALTKYHSDSELGDLTEQLHLLKCPVLLVRGKLKDSLLNENLASEMLKRLVSGEELVLENSGHEVDKKDEEKFLKKLNEFFQKAN